MNRRRDKYTNYQQLAATERIDRDFIVTCRTGRTSVAVVVPHGGGIEPGTSEIATAIAGLDHSLYLFEGIKPSRNWDLHISSSRFDEPRCLAFVAGFRHVITIHGEGRDADAVYLGGRDTGLRAIAKQCLESQGFRVVEHDHSDLQGIHPENICNRGASRAGLQLEIGEGLRQSLFASLTREGRRHPNKRLQVLADAIRAAVATGLNRDSGP